MSISTQFYLRVNINKNDNLHRIFFLDQFYMDRRRAYGNMVSNITIYERSYLPHRYTRQNNASYHTFYTGIDGIVRAWACVMYISACFCTCAAYTCCCTENVIKPSRARVYLSGIYCCFRCVRS